MLTGCMGARIHTHQDPSADFSGLRTFAWMRARDGAAPAPSAAQAALERAMRDAVEIRMAEAGYRASTNGVADVLLDARIVLEVRKDLVPMGAGSTPGSASAEADVDHDSDYGPRWGWRYDAREGWNWSESDARLYERRYEEGTLLLDVYSARTQRVIWRGTAVADIDRSQPPATVRAAVDAAVHRLVARYPAPAARP
jgi:hypothetical protein